MCVYMGMVPPAMAEPPRTVIIDPGHGGVDQGVIGPGGTAEKDLSLKFARVIASRLKPAYRVVLTRTGDYRLDLTRRVSIANQQKGDLFISIHLGGAPLYHVDRWGVYVFSRQESVSAKQMHAPGSEEAGCCLYWDAVQDRHRKESLYLAEVIRAEFEEDSRIPGVEMQKAPLRVLEGLDMPAVVIEAGYLTNPQTEIRLNDESYLNDMAGHVAGAVNTFFQTKNPH